MFTLTGSKWKEVFGEHIHQRYAGRVHRLSVNQKIASDALHVMVEFVIPFGEADEMEMYRRINKVIHVIAEGDDEPK